MPTPAQRVIRALQHAHAAAEDNRDKAAERLRDATEQHARAVARMHDAHAEEQALAAALAEAGGRTWREEQAQAQHARELAELVEHPPVPHAAPTTTPRVGIHTTGHRPERAAREREAGPASDRDAITPEHVRER